MPIITIPKPIRERLAQMTPEQIDAAKARLSARQLPTVADTSQVEGPAARPVDKKKRNHIDRSGNWPEVGAFLEGHLHGETFRAQVIAAPKLKSKRALKLLSAPVKGVVVSSFSKAQDVVTLAHRQKLGVKGKTGLAPAWGWWKPVAAKHT